MTSLGDVTRPAQVTARLDVSVPAPSGDSCKRRVRGTASALDMRAIGSSLCREV
jgi:hypothetical protein